MKHLTFISDRKLKQWINTLWLKLSCSYTQTNSILPKEEKKSIYPFGQELTILNSLMISTGWFTDLWIHFSVSQKWIYQTYLLFFVYLQSELFNFWSTGKNKTRKRVHWTVGLKKFTCIVHMMWEKMKRLGILVFFASLSKAEVIPSVVIEIIPTIKATTEKSATKEEWNWKVREEQNQKAMVVLTLIENEVMEDL